jgi:Hydrazine synthase alpha subunit middle domain
MDVVGKVACAVMGIALCILGEAAAFTQNAERPAAAVVANALHDPADIAFIQTPEFMVGDPARRFPLGSRLVRLRLGVEGAAPPAVTPLTPQFFAAADPNVSFDGRKLLFAGKTERNVPWQIWEMGVEGVSPRQVTHCAGDCLQPVYLPGGEIAYTSLRGKDAARTSQVQVCRDDGSDAHPITFGPGRYEVEAALRSGRLLLSAESRLGYSREPEPLRTLYLVDPDGSDFMRLRQDDTPQAIRRGAVELADGTILFLQRNAASASQQGLALVRPGALHATAIERAHSGYASAVALDDERLLVSRRTPGHRYDLYQLSLNSSSQQQLLYDDAHASSVQAVVLASHPAPLMYRSILNPDRKSGRIICLDAYASKDFANGRLPGEIVRVRALLKTPDGERILGEAPVERDGSFYATVPADRPIRLQLIGAHGEVLKQQRSWMWVRTGEDRGCVGCHESRALAPENRSPMTLQRFDTPTPLMGETVASSGTQKKAQP